MKYKEDKDKETKTRKKKKNKRKKIKTIPRPPKTHSSRLKLKRVLADDPKSST